MLFIWRLESRKGCHVAFGSRVQMFFSRTAMVFMILSNGFLWAGIFIVTSKYVWYRFRLPVILTCRRLRSCTSTGCSNFFSALSFFFGYAFVGCLYVCLLNCLPSFSVFCIVFCLCCFLVFLTSSCVLSSIRNLDSQSNRSLRTNYITGKPTCWARRGAKHSLTGGYGKVFNEL